MTYFVHKPTLISALSGKPPPSKWCGRYTDKPARSPCPSLVDHPSFEIHQVIDEYRSSPHRKHLSSVERGTIKERCPNFTPLFRVMVIIERIELCQFLFISTLPSRHQGRYFKTTRMYPSRLIDHTVFIQW